MSDITVIIEEPAPVVVQVGPTILQSGGSVADATTTTKGIVKLAGALGGTADLPTVPGLATKADLVGGVIPTAQLPPLAINDTFTVASQAAMLALTAQRGDVAIRTDVSRAFILSTDSPGTLNDWKELLTPADAVTSVAGKTGVVSLVKGDVGLGNVDNTSDANKPVSTAQAAADTAVANASIAKAIVDAKGDLIVASAADTVVRVPVGSNDQVLTADSAQASGVKWATPAAGGGFLVPAPLAGEYMFNAVRRGTANNSNGMTVGTLYCIPFYNTGPPLSIDRIAMNYSVVGGVGALIRLGAYEVGADGRIGDLIFDAGTIDATTATGDKALTIAETLPTGVSLLVAVANDNAIRPRWIGSTPTLTDLWWRGKSGPLASTDHSLSYTGYAAGSALPATGTTAGEALIGTDVLMIAVRAA